MNTQTTVALAKNLLGTSFPSEDFMSLLNRGCQRLNDEGLYKGSIVTVLFNNSQGFITLPYDFFAILGMQWYKTPGPIFTQFHPYIGSGPGGWIQEDKPYAGILMSKGDGYATQLDPPVAGSTLKFAPDLLIDSGKVFRIYGISNGQPVFDANGEGMNVTVNYPSTSISTVFDQVTGIQVPVGSDGTSNMIGPWSLYSVAPDATETMIGRYQPPETYPSYQRYTTGTSDKEICCLCRTRFIPLQKDTDFVKPGNIGAIQAAMKAIQNEDATNYAEAQPLWAAAYRILDAELHAMRGGARVELDLSFLGGGAIFNNVI